jgi:hypothetical protein
LAHCIGILLVNQAGVTCCVGIFNTASEKSLDVAALVYMNIKKFSDGPDDWKIICSKIRGFMGDQGIVHLNQLH